MLGNIASSLPSAVRTAAMEAVHIFTLSKELLMKKLLTILVAALVVLAACSNPLSIETDGTFAPKAEVYRDPVRAINMTSPDAYEQDDSQTAAKTITTDGAVQEHNFYDDATDWLKFSATAGKTYVIETWVVGVADTYLYIYDGTTLKASNDDKASGDYGSKITFTAASTKTYYIRCYSYGGKTGTNRGYTISVTTSGGGGGGGITLPQPQKSWTIMVYLDADNNLSSYGTKDIQEMQQVGSDSNINIVVLWDNSSSTHGYYYVQSGSSVLLQDVGEVNMGDPQTAKNFIAYAKQNFPADKYGFVYWNHGGAVDRNPRGVAWDDTNGGDHLSEVEQSQIMNYAVSLLGKKFEFVGFDACLMATAEIYYQYRNFAKYMAASEQTEPGDGWDWTWLSTLKSNPAGDGAVAVKAIFDKYKAWYATTSDVTFSTANLSFAAQLGTAINDFANAAISSGTAGSVFKTLAGNLSNFSGYTKDLVGFMNAVIASTSVTQTVKDKATAVKNLCAQSLITNNWSGSTWTNKAFGTSITMKSTTTIYNQLDICVDTKWDEFCTFAGFPSSY